MTMTYDTKPLESWEIAERRSDAIEDTPETSLRLYYALADNAVGGKTKDEWFPINGLTPRGAGNFKISQSNCLHIFKSPRSNKFTTHELSVEILMPGGVVTYRHNDAHAMYTPNRDRWTMQGRWTAEMVERFANALSKKITEGIA